MSLIHYNIQVYGLATLTVLMNSPAAYRTGEKPHQPVSIPFGGFFFLKLKNLKVLKVTGDHFYQLSWGIKVYCFFKDVFIT